MLNFITYFEYVSSNPWVYRFWLLYLWKMSTIKLSHFLSNQLVQSDCILLEKVWLHFSPAFWYEHLTVYRKVEWIIKWTLIMSTWTLQSTFCYICFITYPFISSKHLSIHLIFWIYFKVSYTHGYTSSLNISACISLSHVQYSQFLKVNLHMEMHKYCVYY